MWPSMAPGEGRGKYGLVWRGGVDGSVWCGLKVFMALCTMVWGICGFVYYGVGC